MSSTESSTDKGGVSGIGLVLIVIVCIGIAILTLIAVVNWLIKREQRHQQSSGLVKTTPIEDNHTQAFHLLSTSGGSTARLNGDLDFQSESRRVELNVTGHDAQMVHEASVHNRVSERIGVGTHRGAFSRTEDNLTRKIIAHTEGGGFSDPSPAL
jgi:hypothetical protein